MAILGRDVGRIAPDFAGVYRRKPDGGYGLEPGGIYIGIFDDEYRLFQGDFGRGGHFQLDDVLCEYRYSTLHTAVSEGHTLG